MDWLEKRFNLIFIFKLVQFSSSRLQYWKPCSMYRCPVLTMAGWERTSVSFIRLLQGWAGWLSSKCNSPLGEGHGNDPSCLIPLPLVQQVMKNSTCVIKADVDGKHDEGWCAWGGATYHQPFCLQGALGSHALLQYAIIILLPITAKSHILLRLMQIRLWVLCRQRTTLSRAAELFFPVSNPECNDATLSFQTLPPTAGDKWDSQETGDRKIAGFILTAFWQTMHKTFLSESASLTICVEDVLLGKWCIRGVAK